MSTSEHRTNKSKQLINGFQDEYENNQPGSETGSYLDLLHSSKVSCTLILFIKYQITIICWYVSLKVQWGSILWNDTQIYKIINYIMHLKGHKTIKQNTICVGHHYTQTNTNNLNKSWDLLQIIINSY
jgi:hypothetical protein